MIGERYMFTQNRSGHQGKFTKERKEKDIKKTDDKSRVGDYKNVDKMR